MDVLVVDDHATNRKLLRVLLEAEGFAVTEAADGREALERLERRLVDVVVSDILMPGMDGFRFCREVRTNPRLRNLPFIIYTSTYTTTADEKLALKAGADRFIRKPCPSAELIAAIREAAAGAGRRTPRSPQLPDELEVTREYSDALVRKLEQKNTDLERAAEELQRQREWLRVTLTSIGDGVIACDLEGRVTFINPVAASLTGWTAEDALGSPFRQVFVIINEKTRLPTEDILARALSERRAVAMANNTVLVARDGREIPVEDSAAPILDEAGLESGVVLVFHDVTEKRRSSRALRRATEEWERTFDAVPDLIAVLDDQHRVVRANEAMAKRLGLTPQGCVGVPCYKTVHGMEAPPGFCPHALTLADGREHAMDIHESRLGGDFLVTTTPLRDSDGRMVGAVHVARDITERKSAEKERQLTADFLALTNRAVDATGLVRDAALFFQGQSGCATVGIRVRQGDDYPYCETLGFPCGLDRSDNSLLAVDAHGQAVRGENGNPALQCMCGHVIKDPKQGGFWTNALLSGSEGTAGPWTRTLCRDAGFESMALLPLVVGAQGLGLLQLGDPRRGMLTPAAVALWERLASHLAVALAKFRAEDGLRSLNETLETQVAERTALAESRSRQLQALAVQLTEAEERERRRIAELLHDNLQQILVGARMRVQALLKENPSLTVLGSVDSLLEDSILQSRRLSHEMSPALLRTTGLAAALQALGRQMQEHYGLDVDLETSESGASEGVPVRTLLFRSIQELLFNVVKHALVRSASVRLERAGGRLTVTVADNGKGFDVAAVGVSAGKSTGLGLLAIRERIHAIGGAFTMESSPGMGSRFTLSVPLDASDQPSPGREGSASPEQTGSRAAVAEAPCAEAVSSAFRVLFVDDHQVIRRGMIELISMQPGIAVVGEACNGLEAIERARELLPDVIVMDVSMPRMDGIEATRRIKSELPAVRIIGLSMLEGDEVGKRMRDAGAETFVVKTGSIENLLNAIFRPGENPRT